MTHARDPIPRPDPAGERDERLAYEHRQDELALEGVTGPGSSEAPVEPPPRRVPAITMALAALLLGLLFFFAGVQAQKLFGGTPPPAPLEPGRGSADDDGLIGGEVIAVRGDTLYLREPDGTTTRLRTRPDSRVARGRRVERDAIRPGELVVAETVGGGDAVIRSLTVVPPRNPSP